MENDFLHSLSKVCEIFNKHSVEYLIVGGSAVALHGYPRPSTAPSGKLANKPDLDFWYNPTFENYYKVLDAIHELGHDVSEFKAEKAPDPKKSFFRLDLAQFIVDLLPELPGLSKFRTSFNKRVNSNIGEVPVPVISYEDLVISKGKLARAKDVEDIKGLNLRKSRSKR
ncbi:MAG: nucleotidyltransferase [Chitinophagaceae bacterium]|nr:nucleotidyltransferase [Chitinophagaceae bacterium]